MSIFKNCGIDGSAIESRYYSDMIDEANERKTTDVGADKPHAVSASDGKSHAPSGGQKSRAAGAHADKSYTGMCPR